MGSFVRFFQGVVRIAVAIIAFLLFGYMEHEYNAGVAVTLLMWLYLFRRGSRVLSTLILSGNLAALYFSMKIGTVLTFVILDSLLLFAESPTMDDTKVNLRPYEAEVRKVLFQHEPSLLHTVDALLDEHKGREKELLYKLNKQYEQKSPVKTPSRSTSKTATTPSVGVSSAVQVGTSAGAAEAQQTPRATFASVVLRIKRILERHDPAMLGSLDRMLEEYRGREYDLLQEIQAEYGAVDSSSSLGSGHNVGRSSYTSPTPAPITAPRGPVYMEPLSAASYAAPMQPTQRPSLYSPTGTGARSAGPTASGSNGGHTPTGTCQSSSYARYALPAQAEDSGGEDTPPPSRGYSSVSGGSSAQLQRNQAVRQAQEEARREMQARIDARWGTKPAGTGASASGGSGSQSAHKRHGYSYQD